MMGDEDTMHDPPMDESTPQPPDQGDEAVSAFIPKAAFGERPPKKGDSLKDFKVVDIDPETGEVEVQCTYDDDEDGGSRETYQQHFDRMMPEEKGDSGY